MYAQVAVGRLSQQLSDMQVIIAYEVGERQYVVIACGGGKMGTAPGSRYVAFALPEELK